MDSTDQHSQKPRASTDWTTGSNEWATRLEWFVRVCHRKMGSPLGPMDLDDVVQEARLTAWEKLGSFRSESSLDTWLYGVARLSILEAIAARRRASDLRHLTIREAIVEDRDPKYAGYASADVAEVIAEVPYEQQVRAAGSTVFAIVKARSLEGRSFTEVAERLERPVALLKSKYYRALPGLRTRLAGAWRAYRSGSAR